VVDIEAREALLVEAGALVIFIILIGGKAMTPIDCARRKVHALLPGPDCPLLFWEDTEGPGTFFQKNANSLKEVPR
jgi:hypothetical protein